MYNDLKQLKKMKGLTDDVKRKIEKAWTWGLITDEQFEELTEKIGGLTDEQKQMIEEKIWM